MNPLRMAAACGLVLALALLPGASPVLAQTAAPATTVPRTAGNVPAPAPLSASEQGALTALFQKLRPATLRLEDCPPGSCLEPDGVGTGFLIGDGYALTAYHVVFASKNLTAVTLNRKRYPVQVIGYDDQSDVALLRVNVPAGTPTLPLAAAKPRIGESVLAIGNGGGAFLTAKTGRLTGLDRDAGSADFPPGTLELNAQLVPGDSGGPIINARGEVVGVVSYIRFGGASGQEITTYAVPVTLTDARLAEMRQGVKRDAPVIGVWLNLPPELAGVSDLAAEDFPMFSKYFDLGDTPGAFFTVVTPGSPAARAGLQPLNYDASGKRIAGDIVTAVNGQTVANFSDFQYAVRRYQPGQTVNLTVLRGGKQIMVRLTLAPRAQVQLHN